MQSFIINLEINQHIKAGNLQTAALLVAKLPQECKDESIKRCKFLLKSNKIQQEDRTALETKLKLMQNEI